MQILGSIKDHMPRSKEPSAIYLKLFPIAPRKGDRRRAQIVEATIETIGRLGIENTSYEAIGARLGINRAHVAYYFKKKEDMIEAAVKYITSVSQEITIEELANAKDDVSRIEAVVAGAYVWMQKFPLHGPTMLAVYHLATHDKFLKKLNTQIRGAGAERLTALVHQLMKGSVQESKLIGMTIQGLITNNLLEFLTMDTGSDDDSKLKAIDQSRERTLAQVRLVLSVALQTTKKKSSS